MEQIELQNIASPPSNSSGHAPKRRPQSVRRTSSLDLRWLDGFGSARRVSGYGRDIYTGRASGVPRVLSHKSVFAGLSPGGSIEEIESNPARPVLQQLLGVRCGSDSRKELVKVLDTEYPDNTLLYFLLDDLAGINLISAWAWSQWDPQWKLKVRIQDKEAVADPEELKRARSAHIERFENVCTGFRSGSDALLHFFDFEQNSQSVLPLANPADPDGWHKMPVPEGPSMRRARRIDMWRENGLIRIDAMFQDSASRPDGGRQAVHEYRLDAEVEPGDMTLRRIDVKPCVLPFKECPGAVANVQRMLGVRLENLRAEVLEKLKREAGCTHLNDLLRSLAELPALLPCLPDD